MYKFIISSINILFKYYLYSVSVHFNSPLFKNNFKNNNGLLWWNLFFLLCLLIKNRHKISLCFKDLGKLEPREERVGFSQVQELLIFYSAPIGSFGKHIFNTDKIHQVI